MNPILVPPPQNTSVWEAVVSATEETFAMGTVSCAMLLTIALTWAAVVVYVGFMMAPSKVEK